jgi:tetratricopeptide (TPR) repeat protein
MDIDSIDLGEDFGEKINKVVGECDVLLALIGRHWLTVTDSEGRRRLEDPADWVRVEIQAALDHNVRVIPVLVQGVSMPSAEDLPEQIAALARFNALAIGQNWRSDVDRLSAFIEHCAAEKAPDKGTSSERISEKVPTHPSTETTQTAPGPSTPQPMRPRPTPTAGHRVVSSELVGRQEESQRLDEVLRAASVGECRVVVLSGEAGIGKSRLAEEAARRARRQGWVTLLGRCSEAQLSLPYLPIVEAVGNFLADVDLIALREELGPLAAELAQLFPQLHPEPVRPDTGDPEQARLRLFEAVVGVLRVASLEGGLVLIVEDLHWADGSTRDLLDYLCRRMHQSRTLVLVSLRSDELDRHHPLTGLIAGWRRAGIVETLELGPLTVLQIGNMVADVFDTSSVSTELAELVHSKAEGNPFVVEELLADAVDRGVIYRTEDSWERKELAELSFPASLADAVLARLERLEPNEQEVVAAASALGRTFDARLLVAVSGQVPSQVQAGIRSAMVSHLVEVDPWNPNRHRFRHALTHEAIYSDLDLWRRQEFHERAADALKAQANAEPVELVHHLIAADRAQEAVPSCIDAAARAEARSAYAQAAKLYEIALPHVDDPVERGRLLCNLGEVLADEGDFAGALSRLEDGTELLEGGGQVVLAATHRVTLGRCRTTLGQLSAGEADSRAARAVLEPRGPSPALAKCLAYAAGAACSLRNGPKGEQLAHRAIEAADEAGSSDGFRLLAYNYLGWALVLQYRKDEAILWFDKSWQEAISLGIHMRASHALFNAAIARTESLRAREVEELVQKFDTLTPSLFGTWAKPFALGISSHLLGRLTAAAAYFTSARAAIGEAEVYDYATTGNALAHVLSELGRSPEAIGLLDERVSAEDAGEQLYARVAVCLIAGDRNRAARSVREAFEADPELVDRGSYPYLIDSVVEILAAVGDEDGAEAAIKSVHHDRAPNPWMAMATGRIAMLRGDPSAALDPVHSALTRVCEAGYRIDEIRCNLLLAEAHALLGNLVEAKFHLDSAIALAVECEAAWRQSQAREVASRFGISLSVQSSLSPGQ